MPRTRHTRRQALTLGAAAMAVAGWRPRSAAAAAPESFELPVPAPEDDVALLAAAGWRTTPVLAAPHRFDLAGVRWARGDRVEVQLRARSRGGPWSRWVTLPPAGDHGPDTGGAAAGTEPAWTGPADEVQLRLRGRARGLRLAFVHAEPAARRAAAGHRRLLAKPARAAQAPRIISRSEWGADSVPPRASPSFGQVLMAFVHHTVTANDYAPEQSAAIVLGIARYHRNTNGWNDIGYNFLVDQYGQVFEGRAGGIDQAIVGAQAQGWNSVSTGVACLGTFTAVPQSDAGVEAVAQLLGWKLSLHGVPVEGQVTATSLGGETNRYRSGTPVVFERISGHRDGDNTTCPGDQLYAQLPDLRTRAARYAGAAPPAPPPTPVAAVSMRTSTDVVRGIVPLQVTGAVQFNDGAPLEGVPVELLYAAPGGPLGHLGDAVCGGDGSFAATVTLGASGTVAARYLGDGVRPPADSPGTAVTILPELAVALSRTSVRPGRRVAVRGTVTPAGATRAEVFLERRDGRRWRGVRRRRVGIRNGRYGFFVRLPKAGRYRVTVAVPGAVETRALVAKAS